jgi:hypothetical protein
VKRTLVNSLWELGNSRHSSEQKKLKEPEKHLIFPNRKMFVTSNRFSMLADISKSDRRDEVLISTEKQDTFNVINKHLNGANKPTTTQGEEVMKGHHFTLSQQ